MKKLFLLISILTLGIASANPIDDNCPQFVPKYGAPVSKLTQSQYLCKKNYAIHYRFDTRTAEYVVEHVTLEGVAGESKRENDFRPDPAIQKQYQSQLSDYAGHPYDRGHLAPAGDNTQSDEIMSESFFLSNMVPQVPNNNRGIWKQLETKVRDYVVKIGSVFVVSGTIYEHNYKTIGENKVGVPTKLFKVIIDLDNNRASAYVFPNEALPVEDLEKHKVTIQEVEVLTGINFNPKLPTTQKLEQQKDW